MFGFKKNKPLEAMGVNLSFQEVGKASITTALQGKYGRLFQDELSIEGALSKKIKENEDLAQIFMSCIVGSVYFTYLLVRLSATTGEMKEFYSGIKSGFQDIQVENKHYFNQEQVNHWVSVFDWYAKQYLSDFYDNANGFHGSKSASDMVSMIYDAYRIDFDESDVENLTNRMSAEVQINTFANSMLSELSEYLQRST